MKERGLYRGSKERGLVYPDGTYRNQGQVIRKLALEGVLPDMEFRSPVKVPLDVNHYLSKASERATQQKELSPRAENYFELTLPRTSIISVMGDLHFGHPEMHSDRLMRELETIRSTGDSYVLLNGDLVDGIFWGGASGGEQSANLDEQRYFLTSLFNALKGKVIVGISGEHDSKWASRSGGDPYFDFSERTGAPYIRGIAELAIQVGEIDYKVVAQHRARGFSMYNKNHPTYRESRFELQDADVYINNHTHRKQISQETIRKFGRADMVTHISSGAYKSADEYADRQGFVSPLPEEMFGCSIRLHADKKLVEVDYDILEAHRRWE